MDKLIFLDTETTGNEIGKDRLCQICYKVGDNFFDGYFKPPVPVSIKAMSITHITNNMLEDKPQFQGSDFFLKLQKILLDGVLVAHNAIFDKAMLESEGMKVPKVICTLRIARYLDKNNLIPEYNLQFLRYFLNLNVEAHAHDAKDDVLVLLALFERLFQKIKEEFPDENQAIQKMIEISQTPSLFSKINFGKYKDRNIEDILKIDRKYLEWLLNSKLEKEEGEEDWIYTLKHYLKK